MNLNSMVVLLASGMAFLVLVQSGVVYDAVGAAVVGTVLAAAGAIVLRYTP